MLYEKTAKVRLTSGEYITRDVYMGGEDYYYIHNKKFRAEVKYCYGTWYEIPNVDKYERYFEADSKEEFDELVEYFTGKGYEVYSNKSWRDYDIIKAEISVARLYTDRERVEIKFIRRFTDKEIKRFRRY